MCHADLESLRLEICLIESRVSKTRDSITPNQVLNESRVFETRDSIGRNQLFISGNSPTQFIILSPVTLSPKKQSILNSHPYTILTLTPLTLTLTHHIASLTAFPSQQFHISGKGFLI